MSFYGETCHAGEGLDPGIVYAVSCPSCHPSDGPGTCPRVFVHEAFVECDSARLCCADCHIGCTGAATTGPSTSTTTAAAITNSSTTTVKDYCLVEALDGESSGKTRLFRWVRDNILSRTPEGGKVREVL